MTLIKADFRAQRSRIVRKEDKDRRTGVVGKSILNQKEIGTNKNGIEQSSVEDIIFSFPFRFCAHILFRSCGAWRSLVAHLHGV